MNSNIRDFIKAIQNANKTATSAYDTAARVTRVEGSTAWVHVEGGVEETPVEMSISCEPGDDVRVRINKGAAYIIGNNTNPPTNDRIIVKYAADLAQAAREVANRAYENLQEILSTYVTRGSSNISTLSSAMTQTDEGTNIYGDIDAVGDNYIQVNDKGIDIKVITTAGEIDDDHDTKELHLGSDYITFTNQLATWEGTMGANSVAIGSPTMAVGNYAFAFGRFAYALANQSVAMGYNCRAEGTESFALGYGCHTKGTHSFATGYACKTGYNISNPGYAANCAFAEGSGSVANGQRSHAENCSTATGNDSHAQGYATQANGWASHSGGIQTIAGYEAQTVIGKRNLNQSDTYFEVGNGSGNTNSNAFDVTTDGYIRTGVGNTKVAFGSVNNYYGWYDSNGSFFPWAFLVNGKVPETLLPSYVDDVIEGYYYNGSFYEDDQYQTLITPERGKIYISLDTDKSYRWSGTVYVELTSGGVVYTAGTGIDISVTNEISVDNTIAKVSDIPVVPTNVSAFTNDAGYLTQHQDLSNYIQKSLTAGLVKNDGTIDTTAYAEASDIPDVSNFISKSQTSGLVKNDGTIDTTTYATASDIPDVSNFISKSQTSGLVKNDGTIDTNNYALASSIPSVGNGTITIQKNNSTIDSFTTNQSSAKTINISISKSDVGLSNVENKSSATIRGELTSSNVTTALGYTPLNSSNPSASGRFTIGGSGYVHMGSTPYAAYEWDNFIANSGIDEQSGINICQNDDETSGIHMNGNTIVMWSPCDDGALWYYDTDNGDIVFHIDEDGNYYNKAGNSFLTSSIFPLSRANGGTGNTLGQAAQLDVPRDSVNPNTAMTTAPASTVRIDECQPMATGAPEANWFHYITTHSLDTRYGSQLALGMTTNNVYSRIYAGSTWGAWKRLAFADEIPSVSGYLPLAGGAMTGASGIQFPIATGNNKSGNWISAGGGYSTGSGKSGVKIIVCDQSDCISGLGQDCGGGPYELSVIAGAQPGTGTGYIRFLKHVTDSATYTKLAEIDGDGNFIPQGSIRGNNYTNGYAVNIGCGLDIYPQSSSAGYGGYIDFHYNQSSADYTSRILEKESGLISFDSSVVINPKRRNWGDGIRINCDANGDGFALIAFGGQAGSAGPQANYQEYGVGKWYDGTFIIKDVTDNQAAIMTYSPGTSGGLFLNSKSKIVAHKNLTINSILETWNAGLRINSEPNRADGYAVVTFGGPSGSYNGTNDSYPMYQIGKTRSMDGAFFLNSRISGVERVLMYGHNAGLQFYSFDQTKQVDIQNDGIRTRTNKLYLHGKDNNYSDGSGEPSSPLILDGFESGQITANSSQNTSVDIASTGDELVLVFLSAASGNSFYAVRLLRNNNGTLQTINLASNGTSIATISLNANQTNYITIKNTSSSYRLYYKILKLS